MEAWSGCDPGEGSARSRGPRASRAKGTPAPSSPPGRGQGMRTRGFSAFQTLSPILLCFIRFSQLWAGWREAAPALPACSSRCSSLARLPAGWAQLPSPQVRDRGCRTVSPAGRTRRGRAGGGAGRAVSPRRAGCRSRSRFPGELSSDLRISIFDVLLLAC